MNAIAKIDLAHGIENVPSALKQLAFVIASARVRGGGCLRLCLAQSDVALEERVTRAVQRTLARMKKKGEIVLFLASSDLLADTTETRYLFARYPSLLDAERDERSVLYVLL